MPRSTPKHIDFGRRCDACTAEVGRSCLKKCSRCKRAHYCSHECQRMAWKTHKNFCRTFEQEMAHVHPDNLKECNKLIANVANWLDHWTFTLSRWACFAMDMANHPVNRCATHCILIRLQRHRGASARSQIYRIVSAEVLTNEDYWSLLYTEIGPLEEAFEDIKRSLRSNDVVNINYFYHGIVQRIEFRLQSIEAMRNQPRELSAAMADGWDENLIHIVNSGDVSKENSDMHIQRTLARRFPSFGEHQ